MSLPLEPPAPRWPRAARSALLGLAALCTTGLGACSAYAWNARAGLDSLAAVASERLELYAATLESELARYAYLPSLIGTDQAVRTMLRNPQDFSARESARLTLARIGVRAGASEILLTDAQGHLLISSDIATRTSAEELQRDNDHFARSVVDGSTDYLFVHPVTLDGQIRGRIVLRLNLAPLEATWIDLGARSQSERLIVLNEQNVAVMSSVPAWKYRWLLPNAPADEAAVAERAPALLPPRDADGILKLPSESELAPAVGLVRTPLADSQAPLPPLLLKQERALLQLGGRIVSLSDPSEVWRQARTAAWGGAAAGALFSSLLLYALHRRRNMRQLLQARNALQQAHDQLERQVDLRTAQLLQTNEELTQQVAQRHLAEDELLQASKLAVLGQMSTGISHEINQPLTALRVLSRNTIRLMEAGRQADAVANLKSIDEMAERMGRIITQLKSFARKDRLRTQATSLSTGLHNVLLLLEHRLRGAQIEVSHDVPEPLQVLADPTRLEQVLINLAGNAIDAMADQPVRQLRFAAQAREDRRVQITVEDTGEGMTDEQIERLFEPFYTTKPAGQGLGLGLVISSKIIREFGGTLRAERTADGMRFSFDLPLPHNEEQEHV